jgi:hypothetical protein
VNVPLGTAAWREGGAGASHVCSLRAEDGGYELVGAGTATGGDQQLEMRFTVRTDATWATRHAALRAGPREITLLADGLGGWTVDGADRADLQGSADVDLECSPATNTLPIRRLALSLGQAAEIDAAWIRFPSLTVERSTQRYERVGDRRYRYSSGTFSVELDVDPAGLVVEYPPFWTRVDPAGRYA